MKETYEPMEIDVQELPEEDVITASEVFQHDNRYRSFSLFE